MIISVCRGHAIYKYFKGRTLSRVLSGEKTSNLIIEISDLGIMTHLCWRHRYAVFICLCTHAIYIAVLLSKGALIAWIGKSKAALKLGQIPPHSSYATFCLRSCLRICRCLVKLYLDLVYSILFIRKKYSLIY